ncbi:hypothetical protein PHYBLDRAFT_176271 [Phycomyces blakesleeanus NRRL 1555(-)]|uniref:Uncharacterized protein n=1 Tax=Phycomyces blakesleeanus (strain ATCC 8743b / DSM 1359 / FGSC 10004 / NBRC 33097 / NRRL 1555) TaxID=763407 RepID=A0A163CST5_PHYB8|nr:hypothetical protein PHYBLDRAFT_176271 [Phycomyces blakesleeanus NRRL 1555(-)]OAD65360.1 hypothetical protein PHYBLDRAFT_176271 [Phycomyces blakesleeanus NRRL 1555(-)]|eukprot:XP_018283400.1 hypothetical protein PHYBLDRAFT_176271 [Phycomyces blakesleeanus NRRL 1555(-)]
MNPVYKKITWQARLQQNRRVYQTPGFPFICLHKWKFFSNLCLENCIPHWECYCISFLLHVCKVITVKQATCDPIVHHVLCCPKEKIVHGIDYCCTHWFKIDLTKIDLESV